MKLATLKQGGRDGTLVVVSRDLSRCQTVGGIATTLQQALDQWDEKAPQLAAVYDMLNNGHARHAQPFDPRLCRSVSALSRSDASSLPCAAPTRNDATASRKSPRISATDPHPAKALTTPPRAASSYNARARSKS